MTLALYEDRYVEAEGVEKTLHYRQSDMMPAIPVASQQNYFDLKLEQLGPYHLDYSHNGRYCTQDSFDSLYTCLPPDTC